MQMTSLENHATRDTHSDKSYWRELIEAWEKSNESQKAFCARMNIRLGTFAHWRGVLTKEKRRENKFIALEVKASPSQNKDDHFRIECPSGHKIFFGSTFNADQFQAVLKWLGLMS